MSDNAPPPPPPDDVPPPYGAPVPPPAGYGAPQYGAPQYGAPQYGAPTPGYGAPVPGYGAPAGLPRPGELVDRFVARLIDLVILGVVYGIVSVVLAAILISSITYNPNTGQFSGGSHVAFNLVFGIVSTVIFLGYFVVMESQRGDTVGKMVMKLKVVGPDGTSKPTLEQAVRRNVWLGLNILGILGTIGSLLGFLLYVVAVVMIAVGISSDTARRQPWTDKFAGGTQVLKVG